METPHVSQDDLIDVLEMTTQIESEIFRILDDNDISLAMSALMSSIINCVIAQCDNIEEMIFYKDMFFDFFEASIRHIKKKGIYPSSPD